MRKVSQELVLVSWRADFVDQFTKIAHRKTDIATPSKDSRLSNSLGPKMPDRAMPIQPSIASLSRPDPQRNRAALQ